MSSFQCDQCKTNIIETGYGYITECEHYPLEKLPDHPRNERKGFLRVLAQFARTDNPVTKSVYREILTHRLEDGDLS